MSAPVIAESGPESHGVPTARVLGALGAARILARRSPSAIQAVLDKMSRNTRLPRAEQVLQWRSAVNAASRTCAGNGCLLRSISVMLIGVSYREAPVWCTGFRMEPFLAHAWVELGSIPIGEPQDIETYTKVLVAGAERKTSSL